MAFCPAPLSRETLGAASPVLCRGVPLHGVPFLGQCRGVQAPWQGRVVAHDHVFLQQQSSIYHFMSV